MYVEINVPPFVSILLFMILRWPKIQDVHPNSTIKWSDDLIGSVKAALLDIEIE